MVSDRADTEGFRCPRCGMVSHNPNDARERYCGNCHRFVDDAAPMSFAEKYAREREWAQTEIGRLFIRFEAALGRAWVTDCRENASEASMRRDWDRANEARAEFLTALREALSDTKSDTTGFSGAG